MAKKKFRTTCDNSTAEAITDMVDRARDITFETFARNTDWQETVRELGYAIGKSLGLHIQNDYAVSFHSSVYRGKKCYFFTWSAIEYVFY